MNRDKLISDMARQLDPEVFGPRSSLPPDNFFGSQEWWEVARNSRRRRAVKDATAALRALDALGFAVVRRDASAAMARAGAARIAPDGAKDARLRRTAQEAWAAMLAAA